MGCASSRMNKGVPGFLRLDLRLHLVLIGGLQSPERIGAVAVTVEELGRLRSAV